MKALITCLSCLICVQVFACCNKNDEMGKSPDSSLNKDSMKLKVTIGTDSFTATLYNNATVTAFKARLPMSINMKELNRNEKYFDLPYNLPASTSNPRTIQTGDLMLYGSNTLVLFYKAFATSFNYTPMGRIDNTSGLAAALGSDNVTVRFELE